MKPELTEDLTRAYELVLADLALHSVIEENQLWIITSRYMAIRKED